MQNEVRVIPIENLRWVSKLDIGTIIDNHKTTYNVLARHFSPAVENNDKFTYDIVCEDSGEVFRNINRMEFMEYVSNNILRYDYDKGFKFGRDGRYQIEKRVFTQFHPDYPPTALFCVNDSYEPNKELILTGREVNRLAKYKDINEQKVKIRVKIMKRNHFI